MDIARAFMPHDQALWLPDDIVAKADRSSMLASLEVRTSFLQPLLREQLATGRLYADGYIGSWAVSRALDEYVSRNHDWTHVLWPLMVLAFWFEKVGGAGAV